MFSYVKLVTRLFKYLRALLEKWVNVNTTFNKAMNEKRIKI